jgi:hypothetical protein
MFAACVARDGSADFKGTPKELYMVLVTFSDVQGRTTEKGYPYRSVLAKALGVSVKTVDRATRSLEIMGLATVTRRKNPDNPEENDANVYALHDGWLIHGVEPDDSVPLALVQRYGHQIPGFDVAGYLKKRGGGDTSVSTPGDTSVSTSRDSGVPQSRASSPDPVSPDDDTAPSGRSPGERRRPTTGSKGSGSSGFAASGNSKPAPVKLTAAERKVRAAILAELPNDLREALGTIIPSNVGRAIVDSLAPGMPRERTPQQLVEYRLKPRWNRYWAAKFYAGELTPELGGGKQKRPFGPLLEMLKDTAECRNLTCEDRHDFVLGTPCRNCEMRKTDQAADRERKRREAQEDADRQARRGETRAAVEEAGVVSADAGTAPAAPVPSQRDSIVLHTPVSRRECAEDSCALPLPADLDDELCPKCRKRADRAAAAYRQQQEAAARCKAPGDAFVSSGPAPF